MSIPRAAAIAAILAASLAAGCARFGEQPEISPDRYAPASAAMLWNPAPADSYREPAAVRRAPGLAIIQQAPTASAVSAQAPQIAGTGATGNPKRYDLPALIDVALSNNPATHRAWESARAAAAGYGESRAAYYPLVGAESTSGYQRTPLQLPGTIVALKQWQSDPSLTLTWTLLDFGRRSAAAEAAREQLAAANFTFNRTMQDVVFAVERTFYALAAAMAAVAAARTNRDLAQTDFAAVAQRRDLGLATQPEYLLAQERVAQSQYELANANLIVADAHANLAVALGVEADQPIELETLDNLPLPETLGRPVEALIDEARRLRPDLAAQVADLKASGAARQLAHAQWYPRIDLAAQYGQDIWSFTLAGPPTVNVNEPQYAALIALRWDLFTGFGRLNEDRRTAAEQRAASDAVRTVELDAVAEVWRACHEFTAARDKYHFALALLASTTEAYAANGETYRQGLSTIIELLTASRDLANARYTAIQSRADLLTAYAAVAYAAGSIARPPGS
ncbi:MAG: TolC family protein [Candidatus Binataceae bacterium]|nr:TolC family protein [Candidatus Binataceae bacterium]